MIHDIERIDWKNPDLERLYDERVDMLRYIRTDPKKILPGIKAHYREKPWEMISDWGVTFDPRNAERDLPTRLPFVLFPKQIEFAEYVIRKWKERKPGLAEKSRDCGISWEIVALGCCLCLLNTGLVIGFGSRKEEYVDKVGQPKSLFWKARYFMANLPPEFRGGWQEWRDAPHMRIQFPDTGSVMTGEAGDEIGRGDRAAIYFVDEAQPLYAKIVTPTGFRLMADICVGDDVLGPDGKPRSVTQVKDCGIHDVIRFTFGDGTSAECSPNHLWTLLKTKGKRETVTLRAHEIADRFLYRSPGGQVQYRYSVPVCEPVQFESAAEPLPLDPYLVGALLGDGSVATPNTPPRITTADREIVEAFQRLLPPGVVLGSFDGRYSYNIVDYDARSRRARSRAKVAVEAAGIAGLKGPDKRVPVRYLLASPSQRLSLLQGLMDTDGSATGGAASFYTSSPGLAEDVRFLVQSLGGTATLNVKPDRRGYKTMYAVHLTLPGQRPFRLSRKLGRLKNRKHPPDRAIVAAERIGRRAVRCISVDAPDGLYMTDSFIVTHNSAYLERPDLVEHSLSQTTNCRIDVSSVKGMNNPFAKKRHEGKIEPFIFDWRDDPRKDDEWYAKQCEELDPVTVAQEIDRDYLASVTGVVIPAAWAKACLDAREKLGIAPTGQRSASLDIADEGVDKNAIAGRTGTEIDVLEEWSGRGSDLFATLERAFDICDRNGYRRLRYDSDGLGASARGDGRVINERRKAAKASEITLEGFRGSDAVVDPEGIVEGTKGPSEAADRGRTNQDYFGNRKAQAWWAVRNRARKTFRWVTQGIACNPDDILSINTKKIGTQLAFKLVTELGQATYKQNNAGKMIINKQPDGMKSPNLADAVVIEMADNGPPKLNVTQDLLAAIRNAPPTRRRY